MCNPALALAAVAIGAQGGQMVMQNQQIQHAKGAAEAQQTQLQAEADKAAKIGPAQTSGPTASDSKEAAAQAAAKRAAALRAGIMSTVGAGLGSTGNPTPNQPMAFVPNAGKKLLGQ